MKTFVYFLIAVVSISCLMGLFSSKAEASDYLGDLCWAGPNSYVKLGFSTIGGGHFLVNGKEISNANGKLISIFIGNAEIEGNNILMTLHSSGKNSEAMWLSSGYITVNMSDLSATGETIDHDRNYNNNSDTSEYHSFSMPFIQCP